MEEMPLGSVPDITPAANLPVGEVAVGDCLKTMASWPAGSVDLVFADPPYNIGYQYDAYEDTRDDADYLLWTKNWIDGCVRLLKPSGSLYILIGDEYAAETRVYLKQLERRKHVAFRNWIIWHYTFGQNCTAKFNRSHAHLFYLVGSAAFDKPTATRVAPVAAAASPVEDGDGIDARPARRKRGSKPLTFTFNRQAVAVPSARQTTYGDLRANPTGKLPDDTWYLRPQETEGTYFRPGEDTWYLSRLCGTFRERVGWHPCQLPESLLERIVKVSSNEGDVVFDPFVGSGTTLAVAARLGRRWIGCELSSEYAAKAAERIRHVAATGTKQLTSQADRGMGPENRKKKPEPLRSAHLYRER